MRFLIYFLLLTTCFLHAQNEDFRLANEAYREGDFAKALNLYEALLDADWESSALYYNLGNTYFRLGEFGEAVWAYERCLLLAPRHEDAQFNLSLVQALLVDEIETVPLPMVERYFRKFADGMGVEGFRWLIIAWMWLIGLSWLVWKFKRKRWSVFGLAFGIILLFITAISWRLATGLWEKEHRAVIVAENVYVKTAPAESAPDAFVLHEGTVLQLGKVVDGWQEIRIADGQKGWLAPVAFREI